MNFVSENFQVKKQEEKKNFPPSLSEYDDKIKKKAT